MKNKYLNSFTQVPNLVFDILLPTLTLAEIKLLLIIIRQTNGWFDEATKRRKIRDRISHSQFIKKSGLSRRIVIATIQKLIDKKLINVTDDKGSPLHCPTERKGKRRLYYETMFKKECKYAKSAKTKRLQPVRRKPGEYRKVVTLKQLLAEKTKHLKTNNCFLEKPN